MKVLETGIIDSHILEIRGVAKNGMVHGAMDPKNGRQSG